MCSHSQQHGLTDETVVAIDRWIGAARDCARWAITELVSHIEIENFAFVAGSDAQEVPVQVRHQRRVLASGTEFSL